MIPFRQRLAAAAFARQVAAHLHVSYATVRSHVRHLLGKLGARSKLEAVVRAADWGLPERGRYSSN